MQQRENMERIVCACNKVTVAKVLASAEIMKIDMANLDSLDVKDIQQDANIGGRCNCCLNAGCARIDISVEDLGQELSTISA